MKKLKGITWDHSRGYTSIVAASQRFTELNPGVSIEWEKRSLQEFADEPIEHLIKLYDLLVIDHPWAGYAKESGALIPLEKHLSQEYLKDQEQNSVGQSYLSYNFDGYQCALAIDAAAPIAIANPTAFKNEQLELPTNWSELIALARQNKVITPGVPLNLLMDFIMYAASFEENLFNGEQVVSDENGIKALKNIRELCSLCDPMIYSMDPISIYEKMAKDDSYIYCPFAYGYSNYSKKGYAKNLLSSVDIISYNDKPLTSVLGGTGLAISHSTDYLDESLAFSEFVASPIIQETIFFDAGGQPGHRSAWLNEHVNKVSNNFFKNTLKTLDNSYVRPRYNGYLEFQDHAGNYIQQYAKNGGDELKVLEKINQLYRDSLK